MVCVERLESKTSLGQAEEELRLLEVLAATAAQQVDKMDHLYRGGRQTETHTEVVVEADSSAVEQVHMQAIPWLAEVEDLDT
jgi:hypothetical protein